MPHYVSDVYLFSSSVRESFHSRHCSGVATTYSCNHIVEFKIGHEDYSDKFNALCISAVGVHEPRSTSGNENL